MEREILIVAILAAAIKAGTSILYATLGEIFTERSGILNLGVEGMMLIGALGGFMANLYTNNLVIGILVAIIAGGILSLIHAFLCITLRSNQVVSGLALTLMGAGLSSFLGKSLVGVPAPNCFKAFKIPFLSDIPFIGRIFFQHDLLVYLSYVIVPLAWFFMYKTKPGLHLRAVGEDPATADSLGVNIYRIRYVYVLIGGMFSGLAGAYLSLAYAPTWIENMTAGKGWIAIALVIFATWDPVRAVLGAYLFGGVEAFQYRIQALGTAIPSFFLKMLPYIFTIIVLVIATQETIRRRIGAPANLGLPYYRGEKK
jgi:simple sugar transport system permease protein